MKKTSLRILVVCGILSVGFAGIVMASGAVKGTAPAMKVSPNTIVLDKIKTITVHTNIPYGLVDPGSLALNGVSAKFTFSDDCGDIVGKFRVADLGLVADPSSKPGKATLMTLTGTIGGVVFSADDVVRVKELPRH